MSAWQSIAFDACSDVIGFQHVSIHCIVERDLDRTQVRCSVSRRLGWGAE